MSFSIGIVLAQQVLLEEVSTKLLCNIPFVPILIREVRGIVPHSFTSFDHALLETGRCWRKILSDSVSGIV